MLEVTPEAFVAALSEAVAKRDLMRLDSLITLFASFCFKESRLRWRSSQRRFLNPSSP